MYSIKPGRGPSAFGVIAAVVVAGFGVVWTISAASMGAPGIFVGFGVVFILIAIAGGVFNYYNATAPNRFSEFDIVDSATEPDPLDPSRSTEAVPQSPSQESAGGYCPFCGTALLPDFTFCPKCGKDVRRPT